LALIEQITGIECSTVCSSHIWFRYKLKCMQ